MLDPFLLALAAPPETGIWREEAPIDFRDPLKKICLVPVTERIMAGGRGFYTEAEIEADPSIIASARRNIMQNKLRKNLDNDFVSVRSNRTDTPCAAVFMSKGRETAFEALRIGRMQDFYTVFVTPDEVLFADKSRLKPANIRRVMSSIKNRVSSIFPEDAPILSMEVLEYDPGTGRYTEA